MSNFINDMTTAIKETISAAQKGINNLVNPTPKHIKCEYCGGTSKYESSKCEHCGAPLNHKAK